MVSNTMQFNAFYECGYCLHNGETVEKGSGLVRVFPLSFPIHHVSYNVHILLHVTEGAKNWGAPWASSAFLYEDAPSIHPASSSDFFMDQTP
ncbi:hypothetical protein OUZ56_032852 [Daphnia magna]|uniref:Uncharacterized protein n=1 Tax=Daphnia magna TaxID=35525 RepID=A0ABR0B9S0_9CRUS|nr:hypothetical protein OUZ56_032852 [Daphnia magna]